MPKKDFEILGKIVRQPMRKLETFPTPLGVTRVTFKSNEITSLCPVTGQPDWYQVTIEYVPDTLCIESKSLKLYFWSFREEGQFCEEFASIILKDIWEACQPKECIVIVESEPRGGISIITRAERAR